MKSFGYKGGTLQDKLCSSCRDFNVSGFCIFVLSFQCSWILHDSKVFLKLNIANFTHQSLLCLGVLVHILKISCIKTSSTGSFVDVIWISISWGWKLQIRPFCSNHRLCAYEYNTGEFTPLMLESCILGNAGGKFWKKTKSYVKILFLINVSNGFVNFECGLFCSHFCVFICGIFRIAVSTRAEVVITHRLSDITQSKTGVSEHLTGCFITALILRDADSKRHLKHSSYSLVSVDMTASHSCCWCFDCASMT